jgi:predicted nucleic acid-binding protein
VKIAAQFVLDSNILIHLVRGKEIWTRLRDTYQLLRTEPVPIISVVTLGEVRSLAYQREWGSKKLDLMEFLLGYFRVVSISDRSVIEAYARIDSHFKRRGVKYGKNDLWIAATASAMGGTLLTTDRDFDAMDPLFLHREWVDPTPVRG